MGKLKKQEYFHRRGCISGKTLSGFYTIRLEIKAVPGASKTELAGVKDGRLRIRLAAASEDSKANAEMLGFLSKTPDCPKQDLWILSGEKLRLKTIAIPLECRARLEGIIGLF